MSERACERASVRACVRVRVHACVCCSCQTSPITLSSLSWPFHNVVYNLYHTIMQLFIIYNFVCYIQPMSFNNLKSDSGR